MGSFLSSGPELPKPIKHSDLESNLESAIEQYRQDFRETGFAVLEMSETFMNTCAEYRSAISDWMYGNSFEDKLKYEAEQKDDLFKELGRKPNIGYVLTKKKKEYLKFKQISERYLFPHQQIYDEFIKLLPLFQSLNELSIDILLSETTEDPKTHNEIPLAAADVRDNLKKLTQIHSSISLIRYFNKKYDEFYKDDGNPEYETKEKEKTIAKAKAKAISKDGEKEVTETIDDINDENVNSEKDKKEKKDDDQHDMETQIANRTVEVPLGEHVDTGLLTFILCSDIIGLDVLDRKTNKYFPAEQFYSSNKHVFVIAGKKMEMFSYLNLIKPTWHQVRIPLSSERFSLLYFVEIQKEG